jgi:hypothetical protein
MQIKIKLLPKKNETFYSYSIRLAEANGYKNPHYIYDLANITFHWNNPNIIFFDEVEKNEGMKSFLGKEIYEMCDKITRNSDSRFSEIIISEKKMPHYVLEKFKTKICTKCVTNYGYLNNLWLLVCVTTCPIHNCKLIDKCNECNALLTWNDGILQGCICGKTWNEMDDLSLLDSCDNSFFSEFVYKFFGYELDFTKKIMGTVVQEFLNLSFLEMTSLVSLIIWLTAKDKPYWSMDHFSHLDLEQIHLLLNNSLMVFTSWPDNFYTYLNSLNNDRNETIRGGKTISQLKPRYLSQFGRFYSKLYSRFQNEGFDFVKIAFEKYLIREWRGGYLNGFKKIDLSKYDEFFYTGRQFTEKFGLSKNTLKKFIENDFVEGIIQKRRENSFLTLGTVTSVDTFMKKLKCSLSTKEAARILGIHSYTVLELYHNGVISALRGPQVDEYYRWKFDYNSILELIDKFKVSSKKMEHSNDKYIPFKIICVSLDNKVLVQEINKDNNMYREIIF